MIRQYKLRLSLQTEEAIPAFWAYRLYAWLLEQIPEELAEQFHSQERHSITQYLNQDQIWTVTLFGEESIAVFSHTLESVEQIDLHTDRVIVEKRSCSHISLEELLKLGQKSHYPKSEMLFVSPTAFKQAGRYAIFPQEELLFQSLIARWNELCVSYPLEDKDALAEMRSGIHIVDYRLRTGRFQLKAASIPCFYGKIILEARLPMILHELWNTLLYFAPYAGMGIKTTLGMGGVVTRLNDGR